MVGAKCTFGPDHKDMFANIKGNFERCFFVNMTDKVECLEDLGLVDPTNEDKKATHTLLKLIDADTFDSDKEVYFKTGKEVESNIQPKMVRFLPTEELTRKIIRAISSFKEGEAETFLTRFGL